MTTRVIALALTFGLSVPALAGAQDGKDRAAPLFGPDKVWVAHLQVKAEDWAAMLPTKSLFGPAGKPAKDKEPRPAAPLRGGFGFDFAYVKVDFNRYVKGQDLHGMRTINLANNFGEPSQVREALAYTVFRAAGVPAPR